MQQQVEEKSQDQVIDAANSDPALDTEEKKQEQNQQPGISPQEQYNNNNVEEEERPAEKSRSSIRSPGSRLAGDAYFCELQDFVDNALKLIAGKIAEKKGVELDTSGFKLALSKSRDDIKREHQMQRTLQRNLDQEIEVCKKREKDVAELTELLQVLKEKTEGRRDEIAAKLAETEAQSADMLQTLDNDRARFIDIKQQMENEKMATRAEIKRLEMTHAEASGVFDELRKRTERSRYQENERVKMLRQKSKLLATLIGQETISGMTATKLHKEVSKILRSPMRSDYRVQSSSRSYSKV